MQVRPHPVIEDILGQGISVRHRMLDSVKDIYDAADVIVKSLMAGGCVYACGNGGSASMAEHFAAELVGRLRSPARSPLPAHALTANTSIVTCISNDFGYAKLFERQVEAFLQKTDVLIGLSTSGSSENVLLGLRSARQLGASTIALIGNRSPTGTIADVVIGVPSDQVGVVQEVHLAIIHGLCELVELAHLPALRPTPYLARTSSSGA